MFWMDWYFVKHKIIYGLVHDNKFIIELFSWRRFYVMDFLKILEYAIFI